MLFFFILLCYSYIGRVIAYRMLVVICDKMNISFFVYFEWV